MITLAVFVVQGFRFNFITILPTLAQHNNRKYQSYHLETCFMSQSKKQDNVKCFGKTMKHSLETFRLF